MADAIMARWPATSINALKAVVLGCAEDLGNSGADATYGHGMLSVGCLFNPADGVLTTTAPSYSTSYQNDYANTGFRASLTNTEIIGWARLREAIALGARELPQTSRLHVFHPNDSTVKQNILDVLAVSAVRPPTIEALASVNDLVTGTDALGFPTGPLDNVADGSIVYIPYEYANSYDVTIFWATHNNLLLVVPAEADGDQAASEAQQYDSYDYVSAHYSTLVVGSARFNSGGDCPANDTNLDVDDLIDCYTKDSPDPNSEGTDDCGDTFRSFCITGNFTVNRLGSSNNLTSIAGTRYTALQIATTADALLALWPNQFDTVRKLRALLLECALDAGSTGKDGVWGQGIASLACLFNPADGMLYSDPLNPTTTGTTSALSAPPVTTTPEPTDNTTTADPTPAVPVPTPRPIAGGLFLFDAKLSANAGITGYDKFGRDFLYRVEQGFSNREAPFIGGIRSAAFNMLKHPHDSAWPIFGYAAVTEEGVAWRSIGELRTFIQHGIEDEEHRDQRISAGFLYPLGANNLVVAAYGRERERFLGSYGHGRFALGDTASLHLGLATKLPLSTSWSLQTGIWFTRARMDRPRDSLVVGLTGERSAADIELNYQPSARLSVSLRHQYDSGVTAKLDLGAKQWTTEPISDRKWSLEWRYRAD